MHDRRQISVIGMGFVGLAIALAFGRLNKVIAFDINKKRILELKKGIDINEEFSENAIKAANLEFTSNPKDLKVADFHIVAVPTPIDKTKYPDLSMLLAASSLLGKYLKKGDIVVYESTVYPGATEERCIPELEKSSHLKYNKDFTVGYSPERINPADKNHVFSTITKVVAAGDNKTLKILAEVYGDVISAGIFKVSSIRIAEATKVIENT